MASKEEQNGDKKKQGRRAYRVTFPEEDYKDVIDLLDEIPKNQIFQYMAQACRFYHANRERAWGIDKRQISTEQGRVPGIAGAFNR